jgi:hypothetical protein
LAPSKENTMAIEATYLPLTQVYPGQSRIVGTNPNVLQGGFARLLDAAGTPLPPPLAADDESGTGLSRALPPVNLAPVTPREMADFAQQVRSTLANAGINTAVPFELSVQPDGAIAAANHPDAARINEILNGDAALANKVREITARNTVQAQARLAASYTRDWFAAVDDQARTAVWARYRALSEDMTKLAGSRTLFDANGATSLALQFLRDRGFA